MASHTVCPSVSASLSIIVSRSIYAVAFLNPSLDFFCPCCSMQKFPGWGLNHAMAVTTPDPSSTEPPGNSNRGFLVFCFFVCVFLGPHLWHMEVPRLGIKLELQLLAYTTAIATQDPSRVCDLHHSSQQRWILNPQPHGSYLDLLTTEPQQERQCIKYLLSI